MRARQREKPQEKPGSWTVRAYALLLRLYPRAHREAFGEQMLQTFRDHYRDVVAPQRQSALRFWLGVLADEGRSLAREVPAALTQAVYGRVGSMKSGVSAVLAVVGCLLLLLGLRVWLSPAVLSAPHGGGSALSSVVGLTVLLCAYALIAVGFLRPRLWAYGPRQRVALRRATILGALVGGGVLAAITIDTLGEFESSLSLVVWGVVVVAAPLAWGLVGLLAARAGGSWRLGVVAALWSGMVSALVGVVGEVASTLLALPRLVQHELSNPDYLAWHQPDAQSYAIASALALGVIGLILAPVVASIAGGIGSGLGKVNRPAESLD
ncbi:MAG TPA: hypothetical protein VF120_13520 [Ktedonobacterales bacterium]